MGPWRNGKTERAGKDWMEDFFKMTGDGPEAQTWTEFEEDCAAVNQARTSKISDSGYSAYQHVFGRNPPQMEDAILECGGADLGVVSRKQTAELTQERSMTLIRIAQRASLALDHKRRWKRALHQAAQRPTSAFWHPGVIISSALATVWTAYRGSVFTKDEAAHGHIMKHMRDLGE